MSNHRIRPVVRAMSSVAERTVDRSRGTTIQIVLGPADGTPNFITRRFTIAPGGRIPCHRHDTIEHEQVVLSGELTLGLDDHVHTVRNGDCVFIPPRVAHWYENRGQQPVVLLCVVPNTVDYQTEWLEPPAD